MRTPEHRDDGHVFAASRFAFICVDLRFENIGFGWKSELGTSIATKRHKRHEKKEQHFFNITSAS